MRERKDDTVWFRQTASYGYGYAERLIPARLTGRRSPTRVQLAIRTEGGRGPEKLVYVSEKNIHRGSR